MNAQQLQARLRQAGASNVREPRGNPDVVYADASQWKTLIFVRDAASPTGWTMRSETLTDSGLVVPPVRPVVNAWDLDNRVAVAKQYRPWSFYGLPNLSPNGPRTLPPGGTFTPWSY